MAFSIRLTQAAQDDITETMDFLMERAPNEAGRWLEGLLEALDSLEELPARHAVIAEAARLKRPLRALLYGSHRVIYEVDDAGRVVSIVRIYHFARTPLRPGDIV